MNTAFLGEHLWYGQAGHLLIIIAFTFSILASIAYFISLKQKENQAAWVKIGRLAFFVHGLAVFGIVATLFHLLYHHYFEYYYVFAHSSKAMPKQYLLASFWEGQEGSFLLWTFWHVVLSLIVIWREKEWEAPVMSVVSLVQVFLSSMLLGVYIFNYKLGSSPFTLLRLHPDMANLPFVQMTDYLQKIKDGRGLNPLLQNYWMVIHPPTLFLGFASTVIPFAFALGGMLKGKFTEWVKPALPWTFFGVMILGTGILMGAAWAYEALSFGGFWAWDPVENASLVPWLLLVGAAHVLIIFNRKGQSLMTAYILCIASFLLILYSTFLTRSGILGDASVHAFTDLGMSGQLVVYLGFFVILAVAMLIRNRKHIPLTAEEENFSSREFWMFIGILVLVISAFQITLTTSIPVFNKIAGTKIAPPADLKAHYNAWQLPIAVIITLLISFTLFLKWVKSDWKEVVKKLALACILSLLITGLFIWKMKINKPHYDALLFTAIFAIIANLDYMIRVLKGKSKLSGATLAHAGFGLIMLGALISNAKSTVISKNLSGIDLGKDLPGNENIMMLKNDTLMMGDYFVSYQGKKQEGVNIYYQIDYMTYNWSSKKMEKAFSLFPTIQTNPRMGNVSEPSTRHFWDKDIYTHISYADLEPVNPGDEYKKPFTQTIAVGDTIGTATHIIIFKRLERMVNRDSLQLKPGDMAIGAVLQVKDIEGHSREAMPVFVIRDNMMFTRESVLEEEGLKLAFTRVDPETKKFDIEVTEKRDPKKEFVIMKAIIFPGINLLWSGAVLLIIGTTLAIRKRIRKNKA